MKEQTLIVLAFLPLMVLFLTAKPVSSQATIPSVPLESRPKGFVKISGQVMQPGRYPLDKYDFGKRVSLRQALYLGGWLQGDADLKSIHLRRQDGTELVLDATFQWMLESPLTLYIRDGDEITVPARPNTLFVAGYVYRQGQQPLQPGTTLRDLLRQPDFLPPGAKYLGLLRKGGGAAVSDVQQVLKNPARKDNLLLQSGDVIDIDLDLHQWLRHSKRRREEIDAKFEPRASYLRELMGLPRFKFRCGNE